MKRIPKEKNLSSILAFSREGYNFIRNRCHKHNSDLFQVGKPFKQIICTTGAEAAELFYRPGEFERKGAIPKRIQKSLTGKKAIQSMDAQVHRARKELFLNLMTTENIALLVSLFEKHWQQATEDWEARGEIILFEEVPKVLFRSVCEWTGTPYREEEVAQRSQDLIALVDGFGAIGPRHRRGKKARDRSEQWAEGLVQQARSGILDISEDKALSIIAAYREPQGEPLSNRMAAIELLNLLRPTVAITYYIAFGAVALDENPEYAERIRQGDPDFTERFVHEIRRFYPIGPFLGQKVKKGFQWKGYFFPKGSLVLLDIYGTNHDKRYWERPEAFWPDNFLHWSKSPFDFIPQGGGDYPNGHRCPGEWITIEIIKSAMLQLTQQMEYEMPFQDLSYSLRRIPTYPASGVVLRKVISSSTLSAL